MTMIEPAIVLLIVLASIYGGLAHLIWGNRWQQLGLFWGVAFGGCFVVYIFGIRLRDSWPNPGGVPLIEASIAAWLLLLIASHGRV